MINNINSYLELSALFKQNNKILYLVGGTVRDILLHKEIFDYDLVTNATPDEVVSILKDFKINDCFKKYGIIQLSYNKTHFDIATLRKEKSYKDFRHPLKITFVNSLKKDVKRRDFTINGMYMNDRFELLDFVKGKKDLDNNILRTIGNPYKRLKEDPLRILRALRFSLMYGFSLDRKLISAIKKEKKYLNLLSNDKINLEFKKIKNVNETVIYDMYKKFDIDYLLNNEKRV